MHARQHAAGAKKRGSVDGRRRRLLARNMNVNNEGLNIFQISFPQMFYEEGPKDTKCVSAGLNSVSNSLAFATKNSVRIVKCI